LGEGTCYPDRDSFCFQIKIYKTIILPVVLYGCETHFSLREGNRLRAFQNKLLRGISGHKRDEMIGIWKILQHDELHNFYPSQNIIRMIKSKRIRWEGHVALPV
jgi:hypothetical protein